MEKNFNSPIAARPGHRDLGLGIHRERGQPVDVSRGEPGVIQGVLHRLGSQPQLAATGVLREVRRPDADDRRLARQHHASPVVSVPVAPQVRRRSAAWPRHFTPPSRTAGQLPRHRHGARQGAARERQVTVPAPLPASRSARSVTRLVDIWDKGKAALIVSETTVTALDGTPLFSQKRSIFARGEAIAGGERGPSTSAAAPERAPDLEVEIPLLPQQGAALPVVR